MNHGEKLGRHAAVPSPRVNATWSACPSGDFIVLFGGEYYDGKVCQFYNDLFVYEIKEACWYKVVTALGPGPRSAHQAVWSPCGRRLYVFGGEFGTSKETRFLHYRDFWCLNVDDWSWSNLTGGQLPPSRSGHRMVSVGGDFIVLFGGFIDTSGSAIYLDDLWLYQFSTGSWKKVDWLNVHAPKPSPRSAFQFCPFPEDDGKFGVLLYGGYCQVKGKSGIPKGQVLHDTWVLKFDPSDLGQLRWDKKKTGSTAPVARSGPSSACLQSGAGMLLFGGVFDEDIGDEFIQGTCSNDLFSYDFKTNKWTQINYGLNVSTHGSGDLPHQVCPRFNSMMTTARDGNVYMFGGVWEVGNVHYTLDDLYSIPTATSTTAMDPSLLITCLRPISVNLSDWRERMEQERREMMEEDEDDSDTGDDDDESDSVSDSEDSSSDDEGYAEQEQEALSDPYPKVSKKHKSLKEYFDANAEFWLDRAKRDNPVATDKELRKEAFMLAKSRWDETSLASSIENL